MLIDVEGHEFSVLDSLNWQTHSPKVIVVENSVNFTSEKNGRLYENEELQAVRQDRNL